MNEQLQQALAAILNKTMAGVETGASFLQAELPDVIQQLLAWKLYSSIAYGAVGALMLAGVVVLLIKSIKKEQVTAGGGEYRNTKPTLVWDCDGDVHPGVLILGTIAVIGAIFGIALIAELMTAMQIAVAPKIFLIEYAASLAK